MDLFSVYMISFLPEDPLLRQRRLGFANKSLDYWRRQGLHPVVYAQGYKDGDFVEGVDYIVNFGPTKRPAGARNELLHLFYGSNEDFGLFVDDDIMLYEGEKYGDSDNMVDILRDIPIESLDGVDTMEPINPSQTPFSALYQKKGGILRHNLLLKRHIATSGGAIFIRNFKKHYDEEVFFEDWKHEDGTVWMGEDVALGVELTRRGRGCYTLMNCVRKDLGWTASTWCENKEGRKVAFEGLTEDLKAMGVPTKRDRFDWSGMGDRFGIARERIVPKALNQGGFFFE